jgi:hypothetical protein
MPAVRVRATSGWQDLTLQGAPGRSGGWQEIGYVEGTPDITVSGTSAVPTTILTLPALIFDGATTIELEFWARSVVPAAAANAYIAWAVWQDGVMLGVNAPFFQLPSGAGAAPAHLKTRIKPSAGSHVYSIRAWQVGGNGTMVGGQSPGCMMFFTAKIVQPQGMGPPLVTTLPSNPLDGQECYYLADATNGIIWHLRYRAASSSAYKWEVVTGPPLFAEVATDNGYSTNAYGDAGPAGPQLALPLAGDYDIEHACQTYNSGAGGQNHFMSYAIGATAAVDADACDLTTPGSFWGTGMKRTRRKTFVAPVTLTAKYKVSGGAGSFKLRTMQATPVRVG